MDITKVDLIQVLFSIKYRIEERKQVYINYEVEQLEKKLHKGKIYGDELILLRIFKERVDAKMSVVSGNITRDQNKRNSYRKPDVKSPAFKGIDVDKVRAFIRDNEFPEPEGNWSSTADVIAERFFEKYLK